MDSLKKFIIYILVGIAICLVGASGVFADTTIDSNSFFSVTGRRWSISSTDYQESAPVISNNWVKHYFNVPSGIYTPPNNFDYITLSYFQHNGNYNPCNNNDYRVSYSLKFTNTSFVNYVRLITFADSNCSYVADSSNGLISVNCPVNYDSSAGGLWLSVWYNEISGNSASDLYLSRYINLSCDLDTSAITDNATENTQNIINNNNQNTQDIINNNNSNTDKIIDSNKVCALYDRSNVLNPGYLNTSSGTVTVANNAFTSDYIDITNATIKVKTTYVSMPRCFYDSEKVKISCATNETSDITIPNNATYFRFSLTYSTNKPVFEICENGNQASEKTRKGILAKLKELFNLFNSDDIGDSANDGADFINDFSTNTFGLTSIVTAPLNLINSLTSSSCTDLQLPLPYLSNKYLILPCMTTIYTTHFGAFFTIYQTITYGIIAYWVCVRVFNQVKDFKNPEHDEIEVVDL